MAREMLTWQERHQRGKNDVIRQYEFIFFKFPLFCNNMDNFVHNAANKMSEFLQHVLVMELMKWHTETVYICVCGTFNVQRTIKNIVNHFIIEENGHISVFQERVEEPVP
jgi:hypothetical protein